VKGVGRGITHRRAMAAPVQPAKLA
jgi:hypothetical protein